MLREVFEQYVPSKAAYESRDMSIALFLLAKKNNWKCLVLGEGDSIIVLKTYLKKIHGIETDIVISESDINHFEKNVKDSEKFNWIIFNLYRTFTSNVEYKKLLIELLNKNIKNKYKIVDMSTYIYNQFYVSFVSFFLSKQQEIIENENIWKDEKSRKIYTEYVASFLEGRVYNGENLKEGSKYFGLDNTNFFDFREQSSWINVGAASGDTIFWQLINGQKFQNIYAIEGDTCSIKVLKKNLEFVEQENIHVIPYYCGTRTGDFKIDDIEDDIALINMDIEGGEKDAILSGKTLINKCKPILAICVYHLANDLLEIPKLIRSIDDSYAFYLRKYESGSGRHYHAIHKVNELVMYAIPEKKGRY